ncbi:MAG: GNAT family N-acetyltransferase [Chloroflexi bacterium]|nr:GNAT family N-acetyltransferase [Chloroflexota bacterium]
MPEAPRITVRPMLDTDLSAALLVRKAALDWLGRSEGRPPRPWSSTRQGAWLGHMLATDPAGAFVAEHDGVAVGFSQAFVRGDIWFLAQLFVLPETHEGGLGQALLSRAIEYAGERRASVRAVIASSSPVAHALYTRSGMYAQAVAYRMAGPLASLATLAVDDGSVAVIDESRAADGIAALDAAAFGAERREDHDWYATGEAVPGERAMLGIMRDGRLAAYGYASGGIGAVSPIAAYEPADQLPLLRATARWLLDHETTDGSTTVLSLNRTMLGALLGAGWRMEAWSYFLTTAPFGRFDRYHPSGGILL